MTKLEAYKQMFSDEKVLLEGVDWNSDADDDFMDELERIREIVNILSTNNREKKNESNNDC